MMALDATLSLDIVIAILVMSVAVRRLDGKIGELRSELRGDIADLRRENVETRRELKSDIHRLEAKVENIEAKVDDVNQRLARLEGRFEGRAERLEAEGAADPAT